MRCLPIFIFEVYCKRLKMERKMRNSGYKSPITLTNRPVKVPKMQKKTLSLSFPFRLQNIFSDILYIFTKVSGERSAVIISSPFMFTFSAQLVYIFFLPWGYCSHSPLSNISLATLLEALQWLAYMLQLHSLSSICITFAEEVNRKFSEGVGTMGKNIVWVAYTQGSVEYHIYFLYFSHTMFSLPSFGSVIMFHTLGAHKPFCTHS